MKKVKIVVNQNDCERVRKFAYCRVKEALKELENYSETVKDDCMVSLDNIECVLSKVVEDIKNFEG